MVLDLINDWESHYLINVFFPLAFNIALAILNFL